MGWVRVRATGWVTGSAPSMAGGGGRSAGSAGCGHTQQARGGRHSERQCGAVVRHEHAPAMR